MTHISVAQDGFVISPELERKAHRYAQNLCGRGREDVEDVISEAALRYWRRYQAGRLAKLTTGQRERYFLQIVTRLGLDLIRQRKRGGPLVPYHEDFNDLVGYEPVDLGRVEASRNIEAILNQVEDPRARDLLILVRIKQLSVPEAAEILGIPLGTAKCRLYRIERSLRWILEEQTFLP